MHLASWMQSRRPLPPRAAYELWAPTYPAEAHNPVMVAEQTMVERLLSHISAKRALDVGTGSGRYLRVLEATGAKAVGIDLSMAMLAQGRHGPRACADALRLPFRRGTFDLVNASLMVGDIADLRGWTREIARVLAFRGHLVYSDFHPAWSENGWQRTFRSRDGVLRRVAFEPHSIDAHLEALAAAGFEVRAIREPRVHVGGRDAPVVAVFHGVKEGGAAR